MELLRQQHSAYSCCICAAVCWLVRIMHFVPSSIDLHDLIVINYYSQSFEKLFDHVPDSFSISAVLVVVRYKATAFQACLQSLHGALYGDLWISS